MYFTAYDIRPQLHVRWIWQSNGPVLQCLDCLATSWRRNYDPDAQAEALIRLAKVHLEDCTATLALRAP